MSKKTLLLISIPVIGTIILALIAGIVLYLNSQEEKTSSIDEVYTIQIEEPSPGDEIIYENDRVKVTFSLTDVLEVVDENSEYNGEKYRERVTAFFEKKASNDEVISIDDNSNAEISTVSYFVDLLDHGKMSIYDKQNQENYYEIKVEKEGFYCGPLCGFGSDRYTTGDGEIVLYYGEWIS
jgi:hypothetical protein